MSFCVNCGCKLEEDSVFCPNCGSRIEDDNVASMGENLQKEIENSDNYNDFITNDNVFNNKFGINIKTNDKKNKKKIIILISASVLVLLIIVCIVLIVSKNNENERLKQQEYTKQKEEENRQKTEYDKFQDIKDKLVSEEENLDELIKNANSKLGNTKETDVSNKTVLEDLSKAVADANSYKKYEIKSLKLGDNQLQQEIEAMEKAYDELCKITGSLENKINSLGLSIEDQKKIEEEKRNSLVWPGTTCAYEFKDPNGYVIEKKIRFGSWIKASDKENLNKAWKMAGGTGNAPDISSFRDSSTTFKENTAVMTFLTVEYTNKTQGYDFTEKNSYIFPNNVPDIYKNGLEIIKKLDILFPNKDDERGYNSSKYYFGGTQGKIYYNNGTSTEETSLSRNYITFNPKMKSNHWGPVMVALAIEDVFTPNYVENGDPKLDNIRFGGFGEDNGNNLIKIPSLWKGN